jgi:hypothetical protein
MSENWPDTLPQEWMQDGNQETLPAVMQRTEMDVGPAKARRRFTAQVKPLKRRLILTPTEKGYFETFFDTTISGGALSFTFPHNGSDVLRFTKEPTLSQVGVSWIADIELEKLP